MPTEPRSSTSASSPESPESQSPSEGDEPFRKERFEWQEGDFEIETEDDESGVAKADDDEAEDRTLADLLDKLAPSGKCAACREAGHKLEVDHVNGRNWDPAALSRKQRAAKYWAEYDDGVKMRALCRTCNASDGAENKQEH